MTTRRDFLRTGTGVGLGAALGLTPGRGLARSPFVHTRQAVLPVCISSANGLRAVNRAMDVMGAGGDPVDAVVQGVNIVERDPEVTSVGYGGLPNAAGVVQLDSCVMHGPTRGAGAVGALEGIKTPSRVALMVMRYTDHVFLVGKGAQDFAVSMGFQVENLLTETARRRWIEWRAGLGDDHYLTPEESGEPVKDFPGPEWYDDESMMGSQHGVPPHGTITCSMVDSNGDISGVTTTSGMAFKVPGRVGDSPIIGAGLYVDNDVGSCGSVGWGELVIKTCGSHTVVELMRGGMHPKDACLEALRRVVTFTVEDRFLRPDGKPSINVNYYAVNKKGEYAAAAIWSGARFSVSVDGDTRQEDSAYLFEQDR